MLSQYAIFGASGFGCEVLPLARQQLSHMLSQSCELLFVDDNPRATELNGHRVLTYVDWLRQKATERFVSIAVSNSAIREKLVARCVADGINFFSIFATNVMQMDNVQLNEGIILCPFVTLTSNISIGRHFHANIYSYVAHNCVIGDYVTFAPGVKCNGNIIIEDHAYIGAGAILRQGKSGAPLTIGRGAIVGMGSVVTKDVAPGTTVIGNPARVMKGS